VAAQSGRTARNECIDHSIDIIFVHSFSRRAFALSP
jgi:hypothetical protein